ncbi:Rieske 2Fe-2S domain-containing protein [Ramlibacter sp. AW1]|uniref:Rieske 2Fe-2S domain-containing protein n=1 Tax=Ramlibacter aurantiacus TaxID=2801330 RepID=A0A936ZFH6_9BURK|nr:Rieske 2Fe-2S domain-containing protein [Ramlibacter aurantiacus]MBL0419323.1 Rieske 2Fe-2S domain-containing protein [Ramlibacter aurantiacus]
MNTVLNTAGAAALADDDLVRCAPGSPGGDYLRRFWQPVYHSADVPAGRALPLKVMGGEFTLYRGDDGRLRLLQARCPHRGTQLSTGWVEGDSLRCMYHGWKFAPDGRCVERPAEASAGTDRMAVRTWPVREYLGLVFAWFGEGEPPPLPRYREFEQFDGLLEIDSYARDCNYFQNLENALDMSHVGFVHGDNRASFQGIGLGSALRADESDWGVTYTFTRTDGRQRVQQFGMPNIFHMTALPNEQDVDWQESLFWWVPVDDHHHMQFSLHRVPIGGEAAERFKQRRLQRRAQIDLAHQEVCRDILAGRLSMRDVPADRVDLVRLQDDVAQVGQGAIASREAERLGRSDIGVTVIRRLWRRELSALQAGRPLRHWTRTPGILPQVWGLREDQAHPDLARAEAGATAEILDIRPHVEVRYQLALLHGATALA